MRRRHRKNALLAGVIIAGTAGAILAPRFLEWLALRPAPDPEPSPELVVRIVGGNVNFTETNLPGEQEDVP